MTNQYQSPLASRYASKYMLELFSSDKRYQTWRYLLQMQKGSLVFLSQKVRLLS